ncbi:MAG: acyltransferase [Candidatus Binatus sp.]|uniref:acyltransferase n=1 Tax=Candidatus Binatus sp. TaxID=2811406 RepID=UPI0027224240|nr:acyltransferase [Candidatus Binatus sp.]MDO8435045.1 acyltransferase [Candidatus Binatus sp.]
MLLSYGRNVGIHPYVMIYGHGGAEIGDDIRIATSCVIIPAAHVYVDPSIPIRLQGVTQQGVKIENDVWLGARFTVLDGVTIGHGSVIGAGSVVTCNVPPMSIAVGTPASVIKTRGASRRPRRVGE